MKPADRARWKKHERDATRILGGERQPSNGKRQVDIEHPHYFIEHKCRKTMPEWLVKAVDQVKDCPEGKLPLVIFVHAPGISGAKVKRYAIMPLDAFAELDRRAHGDALAARTLEPPVPAEEDPPALDAAPGS